MAQYRDARTRENAMYYINSDLDYIRTDETRFWSSGAENLSDTLTPFGLALSGEDVVVEIGCGMGRMTRAIAAQASRVIGVDVSPEMIELGRRELQNLPNVELMVGSGCDLAGIGDNVADVAYSFVVFQHIPEPAITCS